MEVARDSLRAAGDAKRQMYDTAAIRPHDFPWMGLDREAL